MENFFQRIKIIFSNQIIKIYKKLNQSTKKKLTFANKFNCLKIDSDGRGNKYKLINGPSMKNLSFKREKQIMFTIYRQYIDDLNENKMIEENDNLFGGPIGIPKENLQ